jgi:transcriptional regulator with AAA-type ATPase domain/TolB-like protein/Tfp pilus assembly protein PilF
MDPLAELIGQSPSMAALREQIGALLGRETRSRRLPPLLLRGETGTGKSLLARVIHRASSRSAGQFVELSGPAIPEHLLESELFGYERGAFTDARQSKAGLLHVADRGTLFLDEVGLLPLSLQAKLLRVLEDNSVRRLGSTRSESVDVWIISATNEDLAEAVKTRRFREDLYQRLAGITLSLPPLRERVADIELLAEHALVAACAKYAVPLHRLSPETLAALKAYRWPGNVRELNRVIERAVLMGPAGAISPSALELDAPAPAREAPPLVDGATWERQHLAEALARTGWNISRTAAILGITRNTVRARIAKHGLRPGGSAGSGGPSAPDIECEATDETGLASPPVSRQVSRLATAETLEIPESAGHRESFESTAEPDLPSGIDISHGRPSIAVLPFRVEGEDQAGSYFGGGIVEDIIGALASLRELHVISRTSTLRYGGAGVDVRLVGRHVGVGYVLSGSVRRSGARLRVGVELAETTRGTVAWASHFDGVTEDLFALQDQISARVATTIAPHIREAQLSRALRKRPDSLEAYDCVLRGLSQLYQLDREDFAQARTWLDQAIVLDPGYAAPYALLAAWHVVRVHQGWSPDPASDNAESMRLATVALQRDSFDAMALALCGHAKALLLHEFDEAITLFDRAIAASPSSAIAWTRSSPTYSYIGDAREAIRRAQQGLRLSPLDLHVFYPHTSLGIGFYVAGEHDEGAQWGRKAREENPRYTANLRFLAANLAAAGHAEEAREVSQALLAIEPGFQVGRFVGGYAILDPERRDRLAPHHPLARLPG